MKLLSEAPISKNTKVLVRYDLDVPMDQGKIMETYRLDSGLDTLRYVVEKGGHPIIIGHMGQPKGKPDQELSTKQLEPYFEKALNSSDFELLENLRFDPREEENDISFTQELAAKGDIYVNECFSTSHRKHSSFIGLPKIIPGYAGLRLQKEVEKLTQLIKSPQRPFVVLIGGAKLESKMPVVSKFLKIADKVLLGGKLGLEWKKEIPHNLIIPKDYATDDKDIGPNTIEDFINVIKIAKTVLWAGPMGMYEKDEFSWGTGEIAKEIVNATELGGAYSVIGGGDTITAAKRSIDISKISFVSTGGGAMLTFLAEDTLPGIEVLN